MKDFYKKKMTRRMGSEAKAKEFIGQFKKDKPAVGKSPRVNTTSRFEKAKRMHRASAKSIAKKAGF